MSTMKSIVLSLGGSVLVPTLEENRIEQYAAILRSLSEEFRIFVVVGGGGEARRYISCVRALGVDEGTSDELGILVTRMNASMLCWALGPAAYPGIPENYQEALRYGESGKVVVMGGVTPAQTTDAVSAVLAEMAGADLLLNATAIDGIYSADPKTDAGATKFDHLSADELIAIISGGRMNAGANNIIDLVAAKVLQRSGIPMVVLDGRDPRHIEAFLREGTMSGTLVAPTSDLPRLV